MLATRLRLAVSRLAVTAATGLAACAGGGPEPFSPAPRPTAFQPIPYANWSEREPAYRLYPGDVLDVSTPSAPELNRTVTVQPDGRITLPLIAPTMAADRDVQTLAATLTAEYAPQLVHPDVEVSVRQAGPLKVFVGGEVQKPGVYDMPGDIDALQAVVMAGGFTPQSLRKEVVVLRRGPGGRPMMRTVDLRRAALDPAAAQAFGGAVPLRRFDIVYVPRTSVAEAGLFVTQYVRDLLPVQFNYSLGNNAYATIP